MAKKTVKKASTKQDATAAKNSTKTKRGGFKKGQSGNPAGRPKGAKNKATLEAKAFARELLSDETYRSRLLTRLQDGDLPPAVEAMLWHYAYGKPTEQVDLKHSGSVTLKWKK